MLIGAKILLALRKASAGHKNSVSICLSDHRAREGEPVGDSIKLGRIPEDYIVKEARAAGFEPSGTSEINANPQDDRKRCFAPTLPTSVW